METIQTTNKAINKNDIVVIRSGASRGKRGKVLKIIRERGLLVVEKVNVVQRHTKPTQTNQTGGIVEKEMPIQISNVGLYCGKCEKPVRIRIKMNAKRKERHCVKCDSLIETSVQ